MAGPFDLDQLLPPAQPLPDSIADSLRTGHPFLAKLLTTEGITTPMLEAHLETGLRGERRVVPLSDGSGVRRSHVLLTPDGTLIERADVLLEGPALAWADVSEPLGPWLARQGWFVEKHGIEPLMFETGGAPVYGRRYELRAGPCAAQVTELWPTL